MTSVHSIKTKIIVLATIFIDVLGIGIIIPVLPEYIASFHTTDIVVTLLFAVYAFFSFLSAPLLGSWSDKVGRRPVLILSIISSALGWILFAQAWSILVLFIARIIDGIAAGNITAAQSVLADIARDDQERTANMGLFGALFGIGFIVGPAVGGLLSLISLSAPFYAVGILSLVNAVTAYFILPETHHAKNHDKKVSINPFKPIRDGFANREMRSLFFVWFMFGIALALQNGVFALYSERVLGMTTQSIAWIFAGTGILIAINQMVLVPKVWLKYFSKRSLAFVMFILFAVGAIAQSIPALTIFIISVVLTTIGQGNLRMVFGSLIANANPEKRGEYLGISQSLMSLSLVIGPLIATATYLSHPGLPFIIAGIIALVSYVSMKALNV